MAERELPENDITGLAACFNAATFWSNEYSGAENYSFPATIRNFIHALLSAKFTPALYMKIKTIRISVSVMVILAVAAFVGLRYSPAEKVPNIVLITIDTQRWDYISSYGYSDTGLSPVIDDLAARGTRFVQAVSTAGTTIPSHGSMLTGLYPRQHGARSNWHELNPGATSIAEVLGEAGFQTGAFVSFDSMMKVGDLGRGFVTHNTPFDRPDKKVTQAGSITVEQANQWLRSLHRDQPFHLWLHLFEPHGPYEISDYARQRLQDYDGILKNGAEMEVLLGNKQQILGSEQHLQALQHLYAGEVHRADGLVGDLIDTLASLDVLQNTIVILTSDHGQALGENGTMGHGAILWESVIRVPLIITDFRTPVGNTVQERVGTIDIAATIADFAGIDKAFDQHGQSLRNAASGQLDPDRTYFAEVELRTGVSAKESWYDPDSLAVYSGNIKQASNRDKLELYETRLVDNHLTPIAPDQISALAEYLAGLNEEFLAAESRFKNARVSEADRDQLQGLGYTQ